MIRFLVMLTGTLILFLFGIVANPQIAEASMPFDMHRTPFYADVSYGRFIPNPPDFTYNKLTSEYGHGFVQCSSDLDSWNVFNNSLLTMALSSDNESGDFYRFSTLIFQGLKASNLTFDSKYTSIANFLANGNNPVHRGIATSRLRATNIDRFIDLVNGKVYTRDFGNAPIMAFTRAIASGAKGFNPVYTIACPSPEPDKRFIYGM